MRAHLRFLILGCVPALAGAQAGEVRGNWRTLAPLPGARQEVASALVQEKIYILGGLGPGGGARVDVYDIEADQWSPAPALPLAVHHPSAAALDGKVYLIAGFSSFSPLFGTPIADVFRLDPEAAAPQWSPVASLPSARGALISVSTGGRIYAIGGRTALNSVPDVSVYDPQTDQWAAGPALPAASDHLAAAVVDGEILVCGGRLTAAGFFVSNSAALFALRPGDPAWRTLTPMPTPRSGHGAAAAAGFLFVMGGEIPNIFGVNEVYDPTTDHWFTLDPLPTARHGLGIQAFENRIIVSAGGTIAGIASSVVNEAFSVLSNVSALAQFGVGPNLTSEVLVTNSGTEPAEVKVELRGDGGLPLAARLNGQPGSTFDLLIEPGGFRRLSSELEAELRIGSAQVFSDSPVLSNILFTSPDGFAGVPGQAPLKGFLVPALRGGGTDVGLAVADLSGVPQTVTLRLLDAAGLEAARVERELPAFGHFALLLPEIFEGVDLSDFEGSVDGQGEADLAAMAILLREGRLATLAVGTR